jgi:broad specificity phosphatase PhoE
MSIAYGPRMPFLLVRHGSVDYDAYPGRFRGHGIDLLPLSPQGLLDVETAVPVLQGAGTELIVSSPMARALQTAMILSWRLDRRVEVELDLHEWVPDRTQRWSGGDVPRRSYEELVQCGGEWPPGEERGWEPQSTVRRRVSAVLDRYWDRGVVAVVTHSGVIEAMTGMRGVAPCAAVPLPEPG